MDDLVWYFIPVLALGAHHQGRVNSETDQLIILSQVLFEHGDYDYYDFFNSFNGEGFSLLINMAQVKHNSNLWFYFSNLFIISYLSRVEWCLALMTHLLMVSLSSWRFLVSKFMVSKYTNGDQINDYNGFSKLFWSRLKVETGFCQSYLLVGVHQGTYVFMYSVFSISHSISQYQYLLWEEIEL